MDLPRLEALGKYWQENPPVHIQTGRIAAFLGIKPARVAAVEKHSAPSQEELAVFGSEPGPAPKFITPEEYLRNKAAAA